MRILLVENDLDDAGRVSDLLKEEFGPETKVEVAQSGKEALERLTLFESLDDPEMILLDSRLPDGEGLEFIAELREAGDERPLIMMTGTDGQPLALQALRCGADDFVSKSSDFPTNLVGGVIRARERIQLKRDLDSAQELIAALEVPARLKPRPPQSDLPLGVTNPLRQKLTNRLLTYRDQPNPRLSLETPRSRRA